MWQQVGLMTDRLEWEPLRVASNCCSLALFHFGQSFTVKPLVRAVFVYCVCVCAVTAQLRQVVCLLDFVIVMVELSHLLEIMTDMFCSLNKDKEGEKNYHFNGKCNFPLLPFERNKDSH